MSVSVVKNLVDDCRKMSATDESDRPSSDTPARKALHHGFEISGMEALLAADLLSASSQHIERSYAGVVAELAEVSAADIVHSPSLHQRPQAEDVDERALELVAEDAEQVAQIKDAELIKNQNEHALNLSEAVTDFCEPAACFTEPEVDINATPEPRVEGEGDPPLTEEHSGDHELGITDGGVEGEGDDQQDVEDTHCCGKCNLVFTKLEDYIRHKVYGDKCTVRYNKRFIEKQVLVPQILRGRGGGAAIRGRGRPRKADKPVGDSEDNQPKKAPPVRFKRSLKLHTPDNIYTSTAYKCPNCDKTFRREAALNRHVEYDHMTKEDMGLDEDDEEGNEDERGEDEGDEQNQDGAENAILKPFGCSRCGRHFREASVLRAHYLTHSDKREFRCNWHGCTFAFKTKGSLKRHQRRHTGERPFKCEQCQRTFGESGALSRHLKSRTPCTSKTDADLPRYGKRQDLVPPSSMLMELPVAGEIAECSNENEQVEIQVQAAETPGQIDEETAVLTPETAEVNQCRACQVVLESEDLLKIHLRSHLALTPFRCGLCTYATSKKDQLDLHKQVAHHINLQVEETITLDGGQVLINSSGVIQEVEGNPETQIIIIEAEQGSTVNTDLSVPESDGVVTGAEVTIRATPLKPKDKLVVEEKELLPEPIDAVKQSRDATVALEQLLELRDTTEGEVNLVMTSGVHGYKTLHKCRVCGRSFRGSSYLKLHMRSHTGERPHKCSECPKTFVTKDTLVKHMQAHSDERQYQCGECGKMFKRISHVREHLKIHSSDRPYPCHYCDKSFKTTNACKVHLRTHTDIYPWECRFCHRTFREKGSLDRHIRIHTGSKPYKCQHCGRGFAEHGTLNRHLKAKIPCTKQLQMLRERSSSAGTNQDQSGDEQAATVLSEFSSVVADTQQYIIQTEEAQENAVTTGYVMLTADGHPQTIEIITEAMAGDPNVLPGTEYVLLDENNLNVQMVNEDGEPLHLGPESISIEGPITVVEAGDIQENMDVQTVDEQHIETIAMVPDIHPGDAVQQALVEAKVVEIQEQEIHMADS